MTRTKEAELVDHIIPFKADEVLKWDQSNWQSCCRWHHDVVKQKLEARYFAGRLTAIDLRLNSDAAKSLTLALDPLPVSRGRGASTLYRS